MIGIINTVLLSRTTMFFLVNHIKEKMHTELIGALYQENLFDSLLEEDEDLANTR